MSQDGKGQLITKVIKNDKPIENEVDCPCGGKVYAASGTRFARCSNGETRCTKCLRPAKKFGKGLTCGIGCEDANL
jgi:hypothetical protein